MKYLLPLIACMFLCGCGDDPTISLAGNGITSTDVNPRTINLSTQVVEVVKYEDVIPWFENHKNVSIESIASIDRAGHGLTNGYIIIYRNLTVTVEKSAREVALEKLSATDKEALGIK